MQHNSHTLNDLPVSVINAIPCYETPDSKLQLSNAIKRTVPIVEYWNVRKI